MRIAAITLALLLAGFAQPPDPIIEAARAEAARYSQSIPNYLVSRTTTRYQARAGATSWKQTDSVSAEVISQENREVYSDIRINGKPSKNLPSEGVWSTGEFSTLLDEILNPEHRAVFKNRLLDTTGSRPAWRYRYEIAESHSGWDMVGDIGPFRRMRIAPSYSGVIWIDQQTGKVLRIEKSARGVPRQFPLQRIESSTDYSLVTIGEQKYMLPTHTETVTCTRRNPTCFRNETTFQNYRKFDASAHITYENQGR